MEMSLKHFHFNNTEVYKNCSQKFLLLCLSEHTDEIGTDSLKQGITSERSFFPVPLCELSLLKRDSNLAIPVIQIRTVRYCPLSTIICISSSLSTITEEENIKLKHFGT